MSRELRNALLSWGIGALFVFTVTQFLFRVTIPAGIARGQEREARDFAVLVFVIVLVVVFANISYWTYRASKAQRQSAASSSQSPPLLWPLLGLFILGIVRLGSGVFILLLLYGVAVLVFRHAFGVELPNPFGR